MTQASTRRPSVIELHFENQGGQARIVPPDRDIMIMPIEMAIEACRAFNDQLRFRDQFELLVNRLGGWLAEHRDDVSSAYLTLRGSGLLFLVILRGKQFNESVEQSITELDIEVAQDSDYDLIRLSVHALPQCGEDTICSFLSPEMVIELKVAGDGQRA